MWKNLVSASIAALLAAGIVSAFAGQIPFMNPQNLQIPQTGADMNAMIAAVNANAVTNGPASASGQSGLGMASSALWVNPSNTTTPFPASMSMQAASPATWPGLAPSGALNANGVFVTGGTAGVPPTLGSSGSDPNVNLAIAPQGNGVLQFNTPQQWFSGPTLTPCPLGKAGAFGNAQSLPSMGSATYNEALVVQDNLGRMVMIPACIVSTIGNAG